MGEFWRDNRRARRKSGEDFHAASEIGPHVQASIKNEDKRQNMHPLAHRHLKAKAIAKKAKE
jgi:hypothetical protein